MLADWPRFHRLLSARPGGWYSFSLALAILLATFVGRCIQNLHLSGYELVNNCYINVSGAYHNGTVGVMSTNPNKPLGATILMYVERWDLNDPNDPFQLGRGRNWIEIGTAPFSFSMKQADGSMRTVLDVQCATPWNIPSNIEWCDGGTAVLIHADYGRNYGPLRSGQTTWNFANLFPFLGFVADYHSGTLFLTFLGVYLSVSALQLWMQRRRDPNLCPSCGYNISMGTGSVCPECGTAIPTRRR